MEEEFLIVAVQADMERKDIPLAVLSQMLRHRVGQHLFQSEAQDVKWKAFVEDTRELLRDMMQKGWGPKEQEGFMATSKHVVKDLLQTGLQMYGKYEVCLEFYGHTYIVYVSNLNEVAPVMYQLLLREFVVKNGQIAPLPWEQHLLQTLGTTPKEHPEDNEVHPTTLQNMSGAREVIQEILKDCGTYDAMARALRQARESIRAIDPYFIWRRTSSSARCLASWRNGSTSKSRAPCPRPPPIRWRRRKPWRAPMHFSGNGLRSKRPPWCATACQVLKKRLAVRS